MPAEPRQTVALDEKVLPGQAALDPVQFSAGSHTPADPRQTVELDESVFPGQAALEPVQFSAGSQTPAEARQRVALDEKEFPGHVALEPVQSSAGSQTPADARHCVELDANWQLDVQHGPGGSQSSSTGPTSSTVPLPQRLVSVTVTKWPSLDCVRLGVPG